MNSLIKKMKNRDESAFKIVKANKNLFIDNKLDSIQNMPAIFEFCCSIQQTLTPPKASYKPQRLK